MTTTLDERCEGVMTCHEIVGDMIRRKNFEEKQESIRELRAFASSLPEPMILYTLNIISLLDNLKCMIPLRIVLGKALVIADSSPQNFMHVIEMVPELAPAAASYFYSELKENLDENLLLVVARFANKNESAEAWKRLKKSAEVQFSYEQLRSGEVMISMGDRIM